MTELQTNFSGKYQDRICPACEKEDETTEHAIRCEEYKRLVNHNLRCDQTIRGHMNDTNWLREAARIFERIEETRQWLI